MTINAPRRADDLTTQEADRITHAYESALAQEGADGAYALAMSVFRSVRPELPLSIVSAELDLLLAGASGG